MITPQADFRFSVVAPFGTFTLIPYVDKFEGNKSSSTKLWVDIRDVDITFNGKNYKNAGEIYFVSQHSEGKTSDKWYYYAENQVCTSSRFKLTSSAVRQFLDWFNAEGLPYFNSVDAWRERPVVALEKRIPISEEEITSDVIELAHNCDNCLFCRGTVEFGDFVGVTYNRRKLNRREVRCTNCGRVWFEHYDRRENLIGIVPSQAETKGAA